MMPVGAAVGASSAQRTAASRRVTAVLAAPAERGDRIGEVTTTSEEIKKAERDRGPKESEPA